MDSNNSKKQPRGNERNKDDFEKQLLAAFESVVARDYPNPNRGGCPSADQLREIAEAGSKANPQILTHVARCWPCVQDLKRLRHSRR
jgi:hypothetical protein